MLTTEQVVAELGWARKAIKDVLGVTPTLMRPPYGDIDDRVRAISLAMGMVPVIWTSTGTGATFDTNGQNPISFLWLEINNLIVIDGRLEGSWWCRHRPSVFCYFRGYSQQLHCPEHWVRGSLNNLFFAHFFFLVSLFWNMTCMLRPSTSRLATRYLLL
jgi:hypothetical protein